MPHADAVDPRPRSELDADGTWRLAGLRCLRCPAVSAHLWPRCPACGGPVERAVFGPGGTVWSSTVVRIPVAGREPPVALAYVDLDDGPRVLVHAPLAPDAPAVGSRVVLVAPTAAGDPAVDTTVDATVDAAVGAAAEVAS
ncbi:hypothetical protein GCM10009772_51620 [Pseudonocardia alni subsp. carboxydivorans]|uniref:OB-fold domain-containing protein n=1 Tax=Pseudonocardia alni subsp. carboxydivorans TaxID=415010 RepID=A0ABU9AJ20_PSEA5